MFIILVGYINGDVDYFGPFPTEDRAIKYAESFSQEAKQPSRWFVKPLINPHNVVQRVIWK